MLVSWSEKMKVKMRPYRSGCDSPSLNTVSGPHVPTFHDSATFHRYCPVPPPRSTTKLRAIADWKFILTVQLNLPRPMYRIRRMYFDLSGSLNEIGAVSRSAANVAPSSVPTASEKTRVNLLAFVMPPKSQSCVRYLTRVKVEMGILWNANGPAPP